MLGFSATKAFAAVVLSTTLVHITSENVCTTLKNKQSEIDPLYDFKIAEHPVQTPLHPDTFEFLSRMRRICGRQHSDDYFHTLNDTIINEFPWVATLGYEGYLNSTPFRCTGSLISRRFILTSAHCVTILSNNVQFVRLGEYHIKNNTDCVEDHQLYECSDPAADFGIQEIIVHPQFCPSEKTFDIALIKLNRTVTFSDYIRPICLPLPGTPPVNIGEALVTSGWGVQEKKSQYDVKRKVYNRLVGNDECERLYVEFERPQNVGDSRFCTSYLKNTTDIICVGDGGGPVMFSHRHRWHQEGIVSYGSRDCNSAVPTIHTSVAYFVEWLAFYVTE